MQQLQLVYFPYLSLGEVAEIIFDDVKIWNFDKKADEYIQDPLLKDKITNLLATNVRNNNPIKNIGIFSRGNIDFRELSPEDDNLVNETKLILFLCFLSKINVIATGSNSGHYTATSENFTPTIQNFVMENDYISETNGMIFRILNGGYRLHEKKFPMPSYVLTPMRFRLDSDLVVELGKLKTSQKKLYRRILRATDFLYQSYFNDPSLSINSRILMLAGAFEVLLDLPDSGQRADFKNKIEMLCGNQMDKKIRYSFEKRKNVKDYEIRTIKAYWADRFYTLRNHIIHGEVIKRNEYHFRNKQHHIVIAVQFFILIVKELINQKKSKKVFFDSIEWLPSDERIEREEGFHYGDNSIMAAFYRKHPRMMRTIV